MITMMTVLKESYKAICFNTWTKAITGGWNFFLFALSTLRVSDFLSFESVRKADLKAGKRERDTEKNRRWRSCGRDIQRTSTRDALMHIYETLGTSVIMTHQRHY